MKRLLILSVLMGIGVYLFIDVARAQIEVQPLPVRAWPPREGDYIQTSIHPIEPSSKPAKLAYLTGKNAYISIYKFQVEPGERYSIRAEYMGDGKDGTLLLTGDNPLTDYAYTYGPEEVRRSFSIHRGFPGGEISHCKFVQVVNFTVSPTSEHGTLWLVAHSNKPATGFGLWLWRPAISDHAALNETYAPCPGENRRENAGRIEETPLWLSFDPSERKRTNA